MIRWIFFDLGWTLVDETRSHLVRCGAVLEALGENGRSASIQHLMRWQEEAATAFSENSFRSALTRLHLREGELTGIERRARYSHAHEDLYPGVRETLETLSRTCSLGLIANQSAGTEDRLRAWGLRDLFPVVLASAELGLAKPDPRIFKSALAQAGCAPAEAVMVGDRLDNDIAPAKALGWRTVRVLQGFSRFQEPRGPQETPDVTISEIAALPAALREAGAAWVFGPAGQRMGSQPMDPPGILHSSAEPGGTQSAATADRRGGT